jgi:hypothetical protein
MLNNGQPFAQIQPFSPSDPQSMVPVEIQAEMQAANANIARDLVPITDQSAIVGDDSQLIDASQQYMVA